MPEYLKLVLKFCRSVRRIKVSFAASMRRIRQRGASVRVLRACVRAVRRSRVRYVYGRENPLSVRR